MDNVTHAQKMLDETKAQFASQGASGSITQKDIDAWASKLAQYQQHAVANSPQASVLLQSNPNAYMQQYGSQTDIQNQLAGLNPTAKPLTQDPTSLRGDVNGIAQTNTGLGGAHGFAPNPNLQNQTATIPNGNNINSTTGTTGSNTGTSATGTDLAGQYSALLGNTSGIDSAQKAIDDQNNMARVGMQNIAEQPIGMQFISGQQKDIESRNTNLQIPLQQRLANEQMKRQASLDSIKFQLDRSDKAKEFDADEAYRNKALEISKAKDTGFSLSEGEKRYDASGNLIASGGAKTFAPTGTGDLSSKQYTALNQVTTKFQADPIINQSVKGNTASLIADQIIANPSSATSQLKSLYVLVKNLDPDSAVREGELALANQTQSYLQTFGNSLARITEGRVISPDAAVALANATKELMTAWNQTAQKRQQQYVSQAGVLGIGDAFNSYLQGANLGYNGSGGNTGGGSGGIGSSWDDL